LVSSINNPTLCEFVCLNNFFSKKNYWMSFPVLVELVKWNQAGEWQTIIIFWKRPFFKIKLFVFICLKLFL